MAYATIDDVKTLFRPLTADEEKRATALLEIVTDLLKQEAMNVGKDLDAMVEEGKCLPGTVKSVVVDIVARCLMTSTNTEPMTQMSQSALGYSASGTFLVPGGGVFIKKSELSKLGLRRQRFGVREFYD